jgi:pimeloyl-ACP methyl ester carboxylesterase
MKATYHKHFRLVPAMLLLCAGPALAMPGALDGPPCGTTGIVFVADGAGGRLEASNAMIVATQTGSPGLQVRPFVWTHGRFRGLADVLDVTYARCQGRMLAEEVCRCRSANPGIPIYIVGFSAGSYVVLAAAEHLPPDTLERIILLAPSVSACYDLRPALASARQGVDAFTSERDRFYLGLGTRLIGTSDRKHEPAAGKVGFCPPILTQCDAWLAGRLHQHPWDCSVAWTGHDGGHAGSLQPAYLTAFVLPLLTPLETKASK